MQMPQLAKLRRKSVAIVGSRGRWSVRDLRGDGYAGRVCFSHAGPRADRVGSCEQSNSSVGVAAWRSIHSRSAASDTRTERPILTTPGS